jgi:hypothetical protein
MPEKPGIYTTEFWLTAVVNITGAVLLLLAGYGLIKQEEADLWLVLIQAIATAAIPLALAIVNANYIKSRADIKTARALGALNSDCVE